MFAKFHWHPHIYYNNNGSNRASRNYGGVTHINRNTTNIKDSKFNHNAAGNDGGVMQMYLSTAQISSTIYTKNHAENEEVCHRYLTK